MALTEHDLVAIHAVLEKDAAVTHMFTADAIRFPPHRRAAATDMAVSELPAPMA